MGENEDKVVEETTVTKTETSVPEIPDRKEELRVPSGDEVETKTTETTEHREYTD